MAGDPLRDAFRSELASIVAAANSPTIAWSILDTVNMPQTPDALTNFITLRFGQSHEDHFTFGAPGNDFWKEEGDVFVDLFCAIDSGHDTVEKYALEIRNAFRSTTHRRITMNTGQTIRIVSVGPINGDRIDGGWWCETVPIAYRVFNQA